VILCYLENSDELLPKTSLVTISAALAVKQVHGYSKVTGLLLGSKNISKAAEVASKYGLDEIVFVESENLEPYLALTYEEIFIKVIEEIKPSLFLTLANTKGKDFAPRIAKHLDAGQASDVTQFCSGGTFTRPMYAGNVFAEVEIVTDKKVVTVRGTAFEPAVLTNGNCNVRKLNLKPTDASKQKFVSFDTAATERPELTEAEVVVSGGRALKSAENFEKLIFPLADVLGAAVGASRAAVDAGYAPNDWQIGQTGKVVAPGLYIAIGISGAIQHLAGMKDSKVIVAINKDAEAPIFEIADYSLVGDLFTAVPEFTEELKKLKS
jgi:electron transfer flavoprotein alpha subunit